MSANASAPPKYLERPGEPAAQFKVWIAMFANYIHITDRNRKNNDRLTDEDRNHYLFSLLGLEGCRIFSSHPVSSLQANTTHADYVKAVKNLFDKPVNSVRAHVDFFRRYQEKCETSAEYLASLRSLAADCSFGDQEEKFLAIQLVNGCYNSATRLKLLEEREPELTRVLEKMQAAESACATASHLGATNGDRKTVGAVRHKAKGRGRNQSGFSKSPGNGSDQKLVCYGCGNEGHRIKGPKCPALDVACSHCGIKGHLVKCCRKKQKDESTKTGKRANVIKVASVTTDSKFYADFLVRAGTDNGETVNMMIDTGSDVTTVTKHEYESKFGNVPLEEVSEEMLSYGNNRIHCFGKFSAELSYLEQTAQAEIHVVPDSCQPVLGAPEYRTLKPPLEDPKRIHAFQMDSAFLEIVKDFPNLTSPGIGTFPGYKHKIQLQPGVRPVHAKVRSVPIAFRDQVRRDIWKLVDEGVWEPVQNSVWLHPLVIVPKPDNPNELRITSDFTGINDYVIPDRFPLPNIKDLYLKAKGCTKFTKIDLRKAYHCIELDEDSSAITTTITPEGMFRYRRLVMGLTDAGSVFQRKIHDTVADLPFCVAYVDDILVFGDDSNHEQRVREVLARLDAKNFRITPPKCTYATDRVTYLGYVVSKDGISPDENKILPIKQFPAPKSVTEVRRFLGMLNRYSDFIPKLSSLVEPLRELLRSDVKFRWQKAQQQAFEKAKQQLSNVTTNAIFDPSAETIVTTDASNTGFGAVLSQIQDGIEVPIEFASHALEDREKRYAVNELEAFGCVWACEHWSKYLLGTKFKLRTDHSALKSLLTSYGSKHKHKKFHRWVDRLSVFRYEVEYRKSSLNEVADALSRAPLPAAEFRPDPLHVAMINRIDKSGITLEKIRVAHGNDITLQEVEGFMQNGWPQPLPADLNAYHAVRNEISSEQGYLVRNNERIILPASLINEVIDSAHAGHPGICRMKSALRETYWWPKMNHDIEFKVKHCRPCQTSGKSAGPLEQEHKPQVSSRHVWDVVGIDICGPFWTAPSTKSYALVLLDHYSNFPEVRFTQKIESTHVIRWLKEIFARYQLPNALLSDNGPQFKSDQFEDYLRSVSVKHLTTPVYNPQGNGKVEVFNRSLKYAVEAFEEHRDWDEQVYEFLASFRSTSVNNDPRPSQMFLERKGRRQYEPPSPIEKVDESEEVEKDGEVQQEMSHLLNRGPYKVGDKVLTRRPQYRKGQSPWSEPKKIVKVLGSYTYELSDGQVWNARKMRRFFDNDTTDVQDIQSDDDTKSGPSRRSTRSTKGKAPARLGIEK